MIALGSEHRMELVRQKAMVFKHLRYSVGKIIYGNFKPEDSASHRGDMIHGRAATMTVGGILVSGTRAGYLKHTIC